MALTTLIACSQDRLPEEVPPTATVEGRPLEELSPERRGEALYQANCQACHGSQQGEGRTAGAPPHNDIGHTWHHPDAQLKDWVLNGKFPGAMPPFKDVLTEEQVDTVLSYIKTWWTPDQRESQADISQRYQEALEKQQKQ
jgi:mono/diheme cytochrome c family protein